MDEKRKEEEVLELTDDEIDELVFEEQLASGEYDEEVPEYYFSNPDPYAKVEPRPDDAPKRDFTFDEKGNIVVKNLSAFWLPDVKIVDEIVAQNTQLQAAMRVRKLSIRSSIALWSRTLPMMNQVSRRMANEQRHLF